jgi:poly(3-hydroxybutyrate) depolymerase
LSDPSPWETLHQLFSATGRRALPQVVQTAARNWPLLCMDGMMVSLRISVWLSAYLMCAVCFPQMPLVGESTAEHGFVNDTFDDAGAQHHYVLFVPQNYTPDAKWPIIVYLHGAGERGTDGQLPTTVGPGPYIRAQADNFPFFVLFPQCESTDSRLLTGWNDDSDDTSRMLQILKTVEDKYSIDPQRRVLTGWSMGGFGAWSIAASDPEMWSAVVPVSGSGDTDKVASLASTPVWAIHGSRDNVVRPSAAIKTIDALKQSNGAPWLSVLPNFGHDVWRVAYGSSAVYDWMLSPTNEGGPPRLAADDPSATPSTSRKFDPVLEISNAAEIRLGNRMLRGLSYAIPSRVPPDALTGSIPDIHDSTSSDGYRFNVTFARISYSGQLAQATVKAIGTDRLQLNFGLRNVQMVIGSTYIRGSGRSATAGQVTINIGRRRPVWLSIVVQPWVEGRRLKLRTVSSRFNIESDNWSVSAPWGVSTRGLGMTRRKVSNSIVQGLYSRKHRIEREVSAAVPSIMSWVEDTLDISDAGQGVAAIWPLPVYQPDVRIWPESVTTDGNGVSILLGMAAAAPTRQPLPFRRVSATPFGESVADDQATLQLKVNPETLEPLSALLVESKAARINVLDIPGESFVPLVTRDALAPAIPALADFPSDVQIQTELVLVQPLALTGRQPAEQDAAKSKTDHNSGVLSLRAPKLAMVISVRESAASETWNPVATFDCSVEQQIRATVSELRNASDLKLVPGADAELLVQSGQQTGDGERAASDAENLAFQNLLTRAWSEWINGQSFADTVIADLDFQKTRLRLYDIQFAPGAVTAGFDILPISIHNLADSTLRYELKEPMTGWSKTHTLDPGESHEYDVDYSVTWRRKTAGGPVVYTLKPGSHSEFRVPVAGGPPVLFSR